MALVGRAGQHGGIQPLSQRALQHQLHHQRLRFAKRQRAGHDRGVGRRRQRFGDLQCPRHRRRIGTHGQQAVDQPVERVQRLRHQGRRRRAGGGRQQCDHVGTGAQFAQHAEELGRVGAADTALHEDAFRRLGQAGLQHVRHVFPTARAGADQCVGEQLRVGVVELVGPHAQVGHHLGRQAVFKRVGQERLDHALHVEVEQAVGQRRAHVVADGAVVRRVAGRDHHPAVGQRVVADAAIEDQRVGRDLQTLVGSGQLVEKKDARWRVGAGQELGREPDRAALAVVGVDRAAQVDRLDRRQPQVDQRHAVQRRDLPHDAALAHAARTPQHGGAAAQHGVGELRQECVVHGGD